MSTLRIVLLSRTRHSSQSRNVVRIGGGEIVAWGPPEDIVKAPRSYTGQFLKPVLEKSARPKKRSGSASEAAE
jgi:hypothetical protein